jgi:ribosomal protein L21E
VDRDGREITADVAGRERKFDVADRRETEGLGDGDMVVLTVEARGRRTVVTRIESADKTGTITRIAQGGRSVTIEVDGRQETYETQNSRMLDDYREGDRVRIEVEERSNGRHVITAIERRGRGRR